MVHRVTLFLSAVKRAAGEGELIARERDSRLQPVRSPRFVVYYVCFCGNIPPILSLSKRVVTKSIISSASPISYSFFKAL